LPSARVVGSVKLPQRNVPKLPRDLAIGMALAILVLLCPLVLSGHLPPRGLVTGTVYNTSVSGKRPQGHGPRLVFQQAGSSVEFDAAVDAAGRYSATLPPGRYNIVSAAGSSYALWRVPGLHPDPLSYPAVSAYLDLVRLQPGEELSEVTVVAGERVTVDVALLTP
jgi:hypothetical protein